MDSFPRSLTRPVLFKELERLIRLAKIHLDCILVMVSGEFVVDDQDPREIFVGLDVPGPELEGLGPDEHWLLDRLFDSSEWQWGENDELTVHSGIVRAYPVGHPKWDLGNAERMTQRHIASSPNGQGSVAGYLEIFECEGGLELLDEIFTPPTTGDQPAAGG